MIWGSYCDNMKKRKDKGISLEKRVRALFQKAGFETKPKDDDIQEVVILKSGLASEISKPTPKS